jgi:superfamily II DNA helicase RecQ
VHDLEAQGIKCVNISGDNSFISVWCKIEKAEFDVIFTTSELLLSPVGYFFRNIQRNRKSQFHSRLIDIVLDEYHYVKSWGIFHPQYNQLDTL